MKKPDSLAEGTWWVSFPGWRVFTCFFSTQVEPACRLPPDLSVNRAEQCAFLIERLPSVKLLLGRWLL